ncbi:MAG TPA: PQQ-binding-like beta-propeller repeat protein [Planctomycetota bacterium]|jgi:outer membrane protein assembly factor BamB|nr:PQQ-binding-like beta-propeller repeat protein [Planctomycetota bacterium]
MRALLVLAALSGQGPRIQPFDFAVVSDLHVGAPRSEENLGRFAGHAQGLGVAFTIACGDLTETGSRAEWERLATIAKRFASPFHPVLGNHDARWSPEGKRSLAKHFGVERPYRSFDHGGVHFALLDSSIVGEAHGGIDRTELEWLDADLAARPEGSPALVALHHPPFAGEEARYLANEEELLQVLRRRGVRLALVGHGHSHRRWSVEGVEIAMTSNLYGEGARWRRIRVETDRFRIETRVLGSTEGVEEEPVPFSREGDGDGGGEPPLQALARGEWRVDTPSTSLRGAAAFGERVFVAGTEGLVAAHAWATGKLLQTRALDGPAYAAPVVAGERLVVATEAGTVAALRLADLSTLWERRLGGAVVATPAADEHRLYVGGGDGILHALALADGRELWSFAAERHFGPPAVGGDRVFAGNWDGHVYALAAPDGRLLWKRKVSEGFYFAPGTTRPALARDLVVVTFATPTKPPDAPSVLALRAEDGEVAWSLRIGAGFCSPLSLEETLVFSTAAGRLLAVDRATGNVRWDRPLGDPAYDSSPVACAGTIVAGTIEGDLVFFDLDGTERGRVRAADPWLFATPLLLGERLFLPDGFRRQLVSIRVPR